MTKETKVLTPPRSEEICFYLFDWNIAVGCEHLGPGCKNCALQNFAGVYPQFANKGVTTKTKRGYVWNGTVRIASTKWSATATLVSGRASNSACIT